MIPVGRTVSSLLCLAVCVTSLVHCATPPTAKQLWSIPPTNSSCVSAINSVAPVTLNGTTIFATTYTPYPGCAAPDNTLSCVDDATGALLWNVTTGTDAASSLMLAGKHTLIVAAPTNLLGLSPQTGKLLWNFTLPVAPQTVPLQPMLSTDAKTLYLTSIANTGFSLLAMDLTARDPAAPAKIFSGSCPYNVQSSYLVPVNGADIVFVVCPYVYFNVNTSNPKQRNTVANPCTSCAFIAPPIVDAANALIYFASYSGVLVHDYASGKQVATFSQASNPNWWTWMAFEGFTDPKSGALTHLAVAVMPLNLPTNTFELFFLAPYSGHTTLHAISNQTLSNWEVVTATPSRLFLVNTTGGEIAAVNLSTGEWLWTAPSVFTPNPDPIKDLTLAAAVSRDTLSVIMTGTDAVNLALAIDTETGAYLWQYPTAAAPANEMLVNWMANDPDTAVGDVTLFYNQGTLTAVVGTTTGSRKRLE